MWVIRFNRKGLVYSQMVKQLLRRHGVIAAKALPRDTGYDEEAGNYFMLCTGTNGDRPDVEPMRFKTDKDLTLHLSLIIPDLQTKLSEIRGVNHEGVKYAED